MKINDVHCCALTRSSFLITKNSATPLAHSLALKIDLIWGYGGSVPHFIKFDSIFYKKEQTKVPTKVLLFFFLCSIFGFFFNSSPRFFGKNVAYLNFPNSLHFTSIYLLHFTSLQFILT
jgi:hypothetical protein